MVQRKRARDDWEIDAIYASSDASRTKKRRRETRVVTFVINESEAKGSAETDVLHQARARERNKER